MEHVRDIIGRNPMFVFTPAKCAQCDRKPLRGMAVCEAHFPIHGTPTTLVEVRRLFDKSQERV